MRNDFLKCQPSRWLKLEHADQQILKVITERSDLFKDLEVVLRLIASNKPVVLVRDPCFLERLTLGKHHEEDHGTGEKIRRFARVSFFSMLLWGHIAKSSFVGV